MFLSTSTPFSAVSLTLSGREPYDSQSNDNEKKERVEEIIRLKAKPLNRIWRFLFNSLLVPLNNPDYCKIQIVSSVSILVFQVTLWWLNMHFFVFLPMKSLLSRNCPVNCQSVDTKVHLLKLRHSWQYCFNDGFHLPLLAIFLLILLCQNSAWRQSSAFS